MYSKIKEFLNLLNGNYYVFGGMALSKILKNVKSYDWDIIIDQNKEDIKSINKKLNKVFGNVICKPFSFTRTYVGYHTVIYQCGINNESDELFDIKFEDIKNTPTVILNGIKYMDIEGLYTNLVESIYDNQEIMYDYVTTVRKLDRNYLKNKIQKEVEEMFELIEEAKNDYDAELIEEYESELNKLVSKEYFISSEKKLIKYLNELKTSKNKAESLIQKNSERLSKLKYAITNPNMFTNVYMKNLINKCFETNNQLTKRIGDLQFKCSYLDLQSR